MKYFFHQTCILCAIQCFKDLVRQKDSFDKLCYSSAYLCISLYFVNNDLYPKYILSYLITQLKSTCCCCCSNAATAIDLPSLQFHIWLDQQRGNMLPTHIHPTQLRDCWSVTLDRDLVLKDNQRRRNNYQLSKQ